MHLTKVNISTLFLLFVLLLNAQQSSLHFYHLNVNDGLSQNSVFHILQDKSGAMWIATQTNVDCYNGNSFIRKDIKGSIIDQITFLLEDTTRNSILVFSSEGTQTINCRSGDVEKLPPPPIKDIQAAYWLHQDTLLLVGINTVAKLAMNSYQVDTVGMSPQSINASALKNDSILYYATENFVFSYDLSISTLIDTISIPFASSIIVHEEEIIIGTQDMKLYLKGANGLDSLILKDRDNSITSTINSLLVDKNQKLWIGTASNGLFVYDLFPKRLVDQYTVNKQQAFSLSGNTIHTIHQSQDDVVWIGTKSQGINLYKPDLPDFEHYFTGQISENESYGNNVWCIQASDQINAYFIGTENQGLALYDVIRKKVVKFYTPSKQPDEKAYTVYDITEVNDTFWVGTKNGLYSLNKSSQKIYHRYDSIDGVIRKNHYFKQDDFWWIDIAGKGSFHYNSKLELINEINLPKNTITSTIYRVQTDLYIIGTSKGLYLYDLKTKEINAISKSQDTHFSCIASYKRDTLLLGTLGKGICFFDLKKQQISHFNSSVNQILEKEVIYEIAKDSTNKIWISTNKGLIEIPSLTRQLLNRYSNESELPFNEFNAGSLFEDSISLYFGGVNGIVGINAIPNNFKRFKNNWAIEYTYPSRIGSITSVLYSGNNFEDQILRLPNEFRYLNIKPLIFDYRNQENNQMRYRINQDSVWRYVNQEIGIPLTRNDLYGTLRFKNNIYFSVRSSNSDWSTPQVLKVVVSWNSIRNLGIIFLTLSLGALVSLFLLLRRRLVQLNQVKDWINEISRLDTTQEIYEQVIKHLTDKNYFNFDYAIFYQIDYEKQKIQPVALRDFEEVKPTNWGLYARSLEDEDIVPKAIQYDEIAFVYKNKVHHFQLNSANLDKDINQQNQHYHLKRCFVPIVWRSSIKLERGYYAQEGFQEGDISLGVLEIGDRVIGRNAKDGRWHRWRKWLFLKNDISANATRLKLYVNNLAQPYYRAYLKEVTTYFTNEIIDNNKDTKEPLKFLKGVLKECADRLGADHGNIGLPSLNFEHVNILEKKELIYNYNLDEIDDFTRLRLEQEKIGITKYISENEKSVISENVKKTSFYLEVDKNIRSEIGVPMAVKIGGVGALVLSSKKEHYFNTIHEILLRKLARKASGYYLRKKRYAAMAKLSLPYDIFSDSQEAIHRPIVESCIEYFDSKYIAVWERSKNNNTEFILSEASTVDLKSLYKKEGLTQKNLQNLSEDKPYKLYQIEELHEKKSNFCYRYGFKSYISLMVNTGGTCEMFINILSKRKLTELHVEDKVFAEQIVKKAELSIQGNRLVDSIKNISASLGNDSAKDSLEVIANSAFQALNADLVSLYKYNGKKLKIKDSVEAGVFKPEKNKKYFEEADFPNLVLEYGDKWIENEADYNKKLQDYLGKHSIERIDFRYWNNNALKAVAAKRLEFREHLLGVMIFEYQTQVTFDKDTKRFIEAFSDFATLALLNQELLEIIEQELQELSNEREKIKIQRDVYQKEKEKALAAKKEVDELMVEMLPRATRTSFYLILDGVNHEIKHFLLNMMISLRKLIKNATRPSPSEKKILNEQLYKLSANAENIETILQIFDFSNQEKTDLDLHRLMKRVIHFFKIQKYKEIEIDYIHEGGQEVFANRAEISMVIYNTINNAITAIKTKQQGHISHQGKVLVRSELIKDFLEISVWDNGTGIDKNRIEKIFTRGVSTKPDGTGIGLYFVKELIEKEYNGSIRCESKKGYWTKFIIQLEV